MAILPELLSTEINDLTSMFFVSWGLISFCYWKIFQCISVLEFDVHSPTERLLHCFQVLVIMNKATVNICVQVFFVGIRFWWMPGGAVASWFGIIKCSLKEPARFSSRVIISFCIPSEWLVNGSSCYSEILSAAVIVSFWILAIPVNG